MKIKLRQDPAGDSLHVIKYFFIVLALLIAVLTTLAAIIVWSVTPLLPADKISAILSGLMENLPFVLFVILASAAAGTWIFSATALQSKRLDQQLKLNEQLLDMPGVAVLIHDISGKRLFANRLAEQYFGGDSRVHRKGVAPEFEELIKPQLYKLVEGKEVTYEASHMLNQADPVHVEVVGRQVGTDAHSIVLSIIQDISERKKSEEELRISSEKIRRAMDGTIKTMALTTEIRDPYTAGHQQRVAKLATALGREMGLAEHTLKGIEVAGTLHDIGKIYVPAEILSKPGKLRKNEFNIIKDHSEVGYDLLKTIEFPWPVALIVLQHHERMDGSGYPTGISGDNIMLEARIIGVADVVESMASHRPYRPALSIEKALLELIQKKGVLYDADVVDACVRLVSEKNFSFDQP